jgi:hypothetical protein
VGASAEIVAVLLVFATTRKATPEATEKVARLHRRQGSQRSPERDVN